MPPYTLEEMKREKIHELVANTVGKQFLYIIPVKMSLVDLMDAEKSEVSLDFIERVGKKEQKYNFSATGLGPVDALYTGIVSHYGDTYRSLKNIRFDDFQCKVKNKNRDKFDSTECVQVKIEFSNASGRCMTFRSSSSSLFTATCSTLLGAIQFYINCEKAFSRLRFLYKESTSRNRHDLSQSYSYSISELVKIASYEHLTDET